MPHFQQRQYCIFKSDFKIIGVGGDCSLKEGFFPGFCNPTPPCQLLQHRKFWRSGLSSFPWLLVLLPSLPPLSHVPLSVRAGSRHSLTSHTPVLISIDPETVELPRYFATSLAVGRERERDSLFCNIPQNILHGPLAEVLPSLKHHSNFSLCHL